MKTFYSVIYCQWKEEIKQQTGIKHLQKGISGERLLPRINKELLIKTQQSEI